MSVSRLLGIWALQHACDRRLRRIDNHGSGAVPDPLVWSRLGPLRFCWGKPVQHLQRWGPQGAGAAILSLIRFTAGLHEVRTSV